MKNLLASNSEDIFGKISPPPGSGGFTGDVGTGLSRILVVSIQFLIIVASLFALFYMLIGAFMWVTSGGDDDAIQKARLQMTHAVWGFVMIFVALTVFGLVTGDVLGVIKKDNTGGWSISIPRLSGGGPGAQCIEPSVCDSGVCNTVSSGGVITGGTCQ